MRSRLFKIACAVGVAGTALLTLGPQSPSAATLPSDNKTIVHVLNRIGFGPRPGDVEKVRTMGLEAYIEQQLRPERIPDASMEARLAGFPTLRMSSRELSEEYERPAMEARRQRQQQQGAGANQAGMPPDPVQQRANRPIVELSEQKILRAAYSDRQLQEVLTDFWFNHFNVDARKGPERFLLTEYERDAIRPHVLGKFRDLLEATAKSPAMLFYLDNWMSASGTGLDPRSGRDLSPAAPDPQTRRGALGRGGFGRGGLGRGGQRFPAMPARPNPQRQQNMSKGLNENYGRELMELHTLGVDGGYTQKDVTEVARAFTGWTIQNPRLGGSYRFEPRLHDPGQKVVLGHAIKAGGGESDGQQVLDILAKHPSTSHFIATALVRRFVSDTPPPRLVDRVAARFHDTDGDLREVMRTLLMSPEFLSPDAYRAKVKTPFEFVVSAVRATGADVQDGTPVVRTMQQLGMPLYMCQPPTGYKDTADAWVNTGALVSRMNFALQLASGRVPGITVDVQAGLKTGPYNYNDGVGRDGVSRGGVGQDGVGRDGVGRDGVGRDGVGNGLQTVPDREQTVPDRIVETVLDNDVSETTRGTIAKATTPEQMTALALGSPEFQRR